MKKRVAVDNPTGVDRRRASVHREIAVLEELLDTRDLPEPVDGMSSLDRRRLARMQDMRERVQDQLTTLRRLYKEGAGDGEYQELYLVDPNKVQAAPPSRGLWLPASYIDTPPTPFSPTPTPAMVAAASATDGYGFRPLPFEPPADVWFMEPLPTIVYDDDKTLLQRAMRLGRRFLRRLKSVIRDVIKTRWKPEHPHTIVSRERPWYLLHGAHPPDMSVPRLVAPAFVRVVEPQPGGLAA